MLSYFIARACSNEDTYCTHWGVPRLSAHSDAIGDSRHFEVFHIFKGLGDLTIGQGSEAK